jgi:fused signal recognition particle receptor
LSAFDLRAKLQKTRESLVSPLARVFARRPRLSPEDEEDIEELLLGSDMGVEACERILGDLRSRRGDVDHRAFLTEELLKLLGDESAAPTYSAWPRANLVIGINGVGKTTSIAKLAHHYRTGGHSVLLAAGDTFRAAARDQLALWAKRLGVDVVSHVDGSDPAAVAFDACTAAKSRGVHYVIIDTAGRLHTRVNLLEELKKIRRVSEKVLGEGAVETYLTIDATLGQNSLQQAREFTRNIATDGIILTKLDSTAKGGIVIAIKQSLGIPVRFIGAGEAVEDFSEFSARDFVDALLST